MTDAKITLTTEAKNEGLEKLHTELAKGIQSVASMQKELNDLTKATKAGTQATQEQADEMVRLRKEINMQKAVNSQYSKEIGRTTAEITKSVKEMADADKGARGLAGAFKMTEGFTTAFSVAIGNLAANLATAAVSAMADFAGQVVTLGAQMQQSVAQLAAMTGGVDSATEAYRALNDAYRNTNFPEETVMNMGTQLMRMGYSAESAAGLIQLCADAATGLGTGQQGAQQLVDAISRMQVVGELTSKQMTQLAMSGVNMDAAFKSIGMTGQQAMEAVKNGTLDSQKAIGALTEYLHQYDGKMAESKNNTIDAWGGVTGNLQTFCAEIGNSIFDAFNQSEIVQVLIDFTQDLVDMVRSDATGAFTDLKAIAGEVLDFIGGLLRFVLDTVKLIILILGDAYAAFKDFGSQVVEAIRPAVDMVLALYDAVKAVLSSIGKNFGAEVGRSWQKTYKGDPDDPGNMAVIDTSKNRFRTRSTAPSGGRSGAGGGSAAKALSEEEKAVDSLIKKYKDKEKLEQNIAKSTMELAKVSASMMVGKAKSEQETQNKLAELKYAHDQLMDGYSKELVLAGQIKDAGQRDKTIDSIMDQIKAEKALYDEKVKAAEWESNYKDLQKESKSIYDSVFGEPDEWKTKVEQIKEELKTALEEVDAAMAAPDEEEQLSGMAKILKMDPDMLAEDLAKKGQTISEFADLYREELAKTKGALAENTTAVGQWHDYLKKYATDIGKSMGNALADWITGAKTASEALKDFVQGLIKNALQLLAQWISIYGIFLAFGSDPRTAAKAATKAVFGVDIGSGSSSTGTGSFWSSSSKSIGVRANAAGGYISGPGTGTSDSIPAMLSNGEYVLRSSAVDRIGVGVLDAMNAGAVPQLVGGSEESALTVSGGNTVILHLSALDPASFREFLSSGGLAEVKQALFEDNRQFAAEAGVW